MGFWSGWEEPKPGTMGLAAGEARFSARMGMEAIISWLGLLSRGKGNWGWRTFEGI